MSSPAPKIKIIQAGNNSNYQMRQHTNSNFQPSVISGISVQKQGMSTINNRICNVLASIDKLYQNGNFKQVCNRLQQLKEKLKFLQKSGKQFDIRLQMICYYNLACTYQSLAFEKSNEQVINNCIVNINFAMQQATTIISTDQKSTQNCKLKLKFFNIKMLLQQCALLSQLQNHQLALQHSKDALSMLIQTLIISKAKCQTEQQQLKRKKDINGQSSAFAQSLLVICGEQLNFLSKMDNKYEGILQSRSKYFERIKQNSYFWKDNFENNCIAFKKQMKKINEQANCHNTVRLNSPKNQFKTPQSRNSLGVKIKNTWVSELNIGKIMRMGPISYENFLQPDTIALEYSSKNLIQKIVLLCSVYFSIATELRFLQENNTKNIHSNSLRNSQLFHFKSIQIISKYIKQDCPLVDHLITSYLRHYHSSLSPIQEKPSFFQQSQIFGDLKKSTLVTNHKQDCDLLEESDYMIQKLKLECQEEDKFNDRKTYGHNSIKINLFDSGELERDLVKSVDWNKKLTQNFTRNQKQKSREKQTSESTRFKTLKKSTSSNAVKESITINKQKQKVAQSKAKSKSKRNSSSQKCLRKLIPTKR